MTLIMLTVYKVFALILETQRTLHVDVGPVPRPSGVKSGNETMKGAGRGFALARARAPAAFSFTARMKHGNGLQLAIAMNPASTGNISTLYCSVHAYCCLYVQ